MNDVDYRPGGGGRSCSQLSEVELYNVHYRPGREVLGEKSHPFLKIVSNILRLCFI